MMFHSFECQFLFFPPFPVKAATKAVAFFGIFFSHDIIYLIHCVDLLKKRCPWLFYFSFLLFSLLFYFSNLFLNTMVTLIKMEIAVEHSLFSINQSFPLYTTFSYDKLFCSIVDFFSPSSSSFSSKGFFDKPLLV